MRHHDGFGLDGGGYRSDGAAGGTFRILLVEDHADSAAVLARLLKQEGYAVTVAGTLAQAQRYCERGELDLIIADLQLPDGWGWDLLPLPEACRNAPAIALSGYGGEDDIQRSLRAGFVRHIVKPDMVDDLLSAIRTAMDRAA